MVDLSKAKAGQIVHFRCGGSAKIESLLIQDKVYIGFTEVTRLMDEYYHNGRLVPSDAPMSHKHPFDIVRIEDPPFDWKDVKPGMAFQLGCESDNICWFVGLSSLGDKVVFEQSKGRDVLWYARPYPGYSRIPDHDKKPGRPNEVL